MSLYLRGIESYNQEAGGITKVVSRNGSPTNQSKSCQDFSSGGASGGSGGPGSNMAYLDSTAGHRNISGKNDGNSGSGNGNSGSNGSNIQFVPILILCCPNLLRNEPCPCGHQQSVTLTGSTMNIGSFMNLIQNKSTTASGSSTNPLSTR